MSLIFRIATHEEKQTICLLVYEIFGHTTGITFEETLYHVKYFNPSLSLLVYDNSTLVGGYLLSEHNHRLLKGRGLEGLALFLREEYRGRGIGESLKIFPSTLGYDYIWGMADKKLANVHHWLKRRKLIEETEHDYITAEFFSSVNNKKIK